MQYKSPSDSVTNFSVSANLEIKRILLTRHLFFPLDVGTINQTYEQLSDFTG